MKYLHLLVVAVLLAVTASCTPKREPLTAEQIEEQMSSGVVLIKNEYYYTVEINDVTFYFTGIDSDGDLEGLEMEEDEVEPVVAFGTGFFISADGEVCTNHHVVTPEIDNSLVEKNMRTFIKDVYDILIASTEESYNSYRSDYFRTPVGSNAEATAKNGMERTKRELEELAEAKSDFMSVNTANYKIESHSSVGIAYNNTFITRASDFDECVVIAKDKEHDLAVIQLKNKQTPAGCGIFNVYSPNGDGRFADNDGNELVDFEGEPVDIDHLRLGDRLYMIGYNLGPALALTDDGVKAQITSGEISQKTNNETMMYTIPALHGSSGSPVINQYGDLVGINFAGLSSTQSFNYGVKVKFLRELIDK